MMGFHKSSVLIIPQVVIIFFLGCSLNNREEIRQPEVIAKMTQCKYRNEYEQISLSFDVEIVNNETFPITLLFDKTQITQIGTFATNDSIRTQDLLPTAYSMS